MTFKLKLLMTACVLSLAACGGGSSGNGDSGVGGGGGTETSPGTGTGPGAELSPGTGGGGTGSGDTGTGGTGTGGTGSGGTGGAGGTEGSGGTGGTGGTVGEAVPPIRSIDYASVKIEPTTYFNASDASFCSSETDKSKIRAYLGANTITYASAGVSDADQQNTARYAEAAAVYIKGKLGIPSSTEGFDGLISVCADGRQGPGNGGAGDRYIMVEPTSRGDDGYDQPGDTLKSLVLHELIHVAQISLSQCGNRGVNFLPKWFSEGSALYLAGQDQIYSDDIDRVRRAGNGENPYTWIPNGYPNFDRYPAYRLAVEALVKESGKTDADLWSFMRSYFAQNPCTSGDTIFNPAISAAFGNLLDNPAYINGFWTTTLPKYAVKF